MIDEQTAASAVTTPNAEIQTPAAEVQPEVVPAAAAEQNEDKVRADRAERAAMRLRREKAAEKAKADFYREQAEKHQPHPPQEAVQMTKADLEAEFQRREWQRAQNEKSQRVVQKIEKAKAADPDFADALENSAGDFNHEQLAVLTEAIDSSDVGVDVLRYLTKNPDEADRLSKLSPILLAREFGRLEAKVEDLAKPKPSNAPKPLDPTRNQTTVSNAYRPDMSDAAFSKWRREQIKARGS